MKRRQGKDFLEKKRKAGCIKNFKKRRGCSPPFELPIFKEIVHGRRLKGKKKSRFSSENVAFTLWLVYLQFHDFINVHLQLQCCTKDFN